jgi:hypothetical protein
MHEDDPRRGEGDDEEPGEPPLRDPSPDDFEADEPPPHERILDPSPDDQE